MKLSDGHDELLCKKCLKNGERVYNMRYYYDVNQASGLCAWHLILPSLRKSEYKAVVSLIMSIMKINPEKFDKIIPKRNKRFKKEYKMFVWEAV